MSSEYGSGHEESVQACWQRYCTGDNDAMGVLYELLHARLTLYCYGWMKDQALAENMASESFVRLLNTSKHTEIDHVEGWLFRVARNLCLNQLNQQANRRSIWEQIGQRFATIKAPEALDQLASQDWRDRMEQWFSKEDQLIWQLHEEGYTNEEIAVKTGLQAKTVANRKSIIRNELRDKIRQYGS